MVSWKEKTKLKGSFMVRASLLVLVSVICGTTTHLFWFQDFNLRDIFSADETAFFWKQLCTHTINEKGQICHGSTIFKDRISIILCASCLGEKIPPLVIGKAENPRCFKDQDRNSFGIHYVSNKKGWMTKNLFNTLLEVWDKKLISDNRKILLFVDNLSGNRVDADFSNIKVIFFPSNTTSHLQPLDAGLIFILKTKYKSLLQSKIVANVPLVDVSLNLKATSLLDAVKLIGLSWAEIEPDSVKKCFLKCGFPVPIWIHWLKILIQNERLYCHLSWGSVPMI